MALHKRTSTPKMPFPGESPTVSLALVAGQKYGLTEVEQAPPKASPSKGGKKKAAAKPARKPSAANNGKTTTK